MTKTEAEIKEFIDSREVLMKSELIRFIYPNYDYKKAGGYYTKLKFLRWWDYVLQTKDWAKLKEHRNYREKNANKKGERFNRVREIYKTDNRLQEFGKRRIRNLLIKVYDLDIPLASLARYLKELKQEPQCIPKSS